LAQTAILEAMLKVPLVTTEFFNTLNRRSARQLGFNLHKALLSHTGHQMLNKGLKIIESV